MPNTTSVLKNSKSIILYDHNTTTFEAKATVKCDTGYVYPIGKSNITEYQMTCESNGQWKKGGDCVKIDCLMPNTTSVLKNSKSIILYDHNTTTFEAKATVKCDTGYVYPIGKSNITEYQMTCESNGQWKKGGDCVKIDCLMPNTTSVLKNSKSIILYDHNTTTFEAKATVKCNTGYVYPIGKSNITEYQMTCESNGQWKKGGDCVKIDCLMPNTTSVIKNSKSIILYDHNTTTFEAKATVKCDTGYVYPIGKSNITEYQMTCESNGQWKKGGDCVKIDCLMPNTTSVLKNSKSIILYDHNTTTFEAKATVKCDTGYVYPIGKSNITEYQMTCESNGQWKKGGDCVKI
ncbi:CUB and sushi domain-containing protein 3-like, partial [Ruditapes philippinarum]|uniref:CUB and sushi domain-containing protein 3-like n=1 Tax=Ruditapes philippinarum TaxID=129788 RepID=UPI00295AF15C